MFAQVFALRTRHRGSTTSSRRTTQAVSDALPLSFICKLRIFISLYLNNQLLRRIFQYESLVSFMTTLCHFSVHFTALFVHCVSSVPVKCCFFTFVIDFCGVFVRFFQVHVMERSEKTNGRVKNVRKLKLTIVASANVCAVILIMQCTVALFCIISNEALKLFKVKFPLH